MEVQIKDRKQEIEYLRMAYGGDGMNGDGKSDHAHNPLTLIRSTDWPNLTLADEPSAG